MPWPWVGVTEVPLVFSTLSSPNLINPALLSPADRLAELADILGAWGYPGSAPDSQLVYLQDYVRHFPALYRCPERPWP